MFTAPAIGISYIKELYALLVSNHVDLTDMPAQLISDITCEPMLDPVTAQDGFVYDRSMIETWVKKSGTSPKMLEEIECVFLEHKNYRTQMRQYLERKAQQAGIKLGAYPDRVKSVASTASTSSSSSSAPASHLKNLEVASTASTSSSAFTSSSSFPAPATRLKTLQVSPKVDKTQPKVPKEIATSSTSSQLQSGSIGFFGQFKKFFTMSKKLDETKKVEDHPRVFDILFIDNNRAGRGIFTTDDEFSSDIIGVDFIVRKCDHHRVRIWDTLAQLRFSIPHYVKGKQAVIVDLNPNDMIIDMEGGKLMRPSEGLMCLEGNLSKVEEFIDASVPRVLLVTQASLLSAMDKDIFPIFKIKLERMAATDNLDGPIFCDSLAGSVHGVAVIPMSEVLPMIVAKIQAFEAAKLGTESVLPRL